MNEIKTGMLAAISLLAVQAGAQPGDAVAIFEDRIISGSNRHGIFISDDGGRRWHAANQGSKNLTVRCLHVAGKIILAGTNDGIYLSDNNGRSWTSCFPGKQINGLTSLNGKIYAAFIDGVLLSLNNGKSWRSIFDKSAVHNISNNGEYIFAICYGPGVLKTKDDGLHWIQSDAGLPNLYTFQIARINNRLIAGQWDGIYTSDNYGQSWRKSRGLPAGSAFKELAITNIGIITGR